LALPLVGRMIVLIGHHSALIALVASRYGTS
jgi:hypothetical protein